MKTKKRKIKKSVKSDNRFIIPRITHTPHTSLNPPILTPETIGLAIKTARKRLNLRQAEAAGMCNVSPKFLSEIEAGKETAHLGKTLSVLRTLGIRVLVLSPTTSIPPPTTNNKVQK